MRFIDKHVRRTSSESERDGQARGEPRVVISDPELDHLSPKTAQHVDFLSNQFATDPVDTNSISIDTSQNASFRTSKLPATPTQYYTPHYENRRNRVAEQNHHSAASMRWLDIASFAQMKTSELPPSEKVKNQRPRRRKR